MVKRLVNWTHVAIIQRRSILKYWTKRNGSTAYAIKLLELIDLQLKVIEEQPLGFKEADFPDTRESAIGHFSLFYKVTDSYITVTAFWDNRQDPKKLLQIIKAH